MKVRCNSCMSVFYKEFLVNKACPCCGVSECITELPKKDFPQYYENALKEDKTMEKYTLKEYKDFSSEALVCPPMEEFEDGTIDEEKWYEDHKIRIIVGEHEMEIDYYAYSVNELDWALREMYEEEYGNGEPTTGNTVGSEYRHAELRDILRVAIQNDYESWGWEMRDIGAFVREFIKRYDDIMNVMGVYFDVIFKDVKHYTDIFKCNFGKLNMYSLRSVGKGTIKNAVAQIIGTDTEFLVGYDDEMKCSDITFVMDYTIKPSGELIGWFYGEADDDYIGQLIADYIKKLFKED